MSEKTLEILNTTSILVVEDDDIAREVIKDGLKPYCKAVWSAKDGVDGLEKFTKLSPDIILTDIHMPHMNGFDMMSAISRLKPSQQFIVFTSFDSDDNLIQSLKHGALSLLKKPINMNELYRTLITLAYKNDEKFLQISQNVRADTKKERVFVGETEVFLSYQQHRFFWLLAHNIGNLVSYDMIEEFVYNGESVNKNAIQKLASRLKSELGVSVKNVFERGYVMEKFYST